MMVLIFVYFKDKNFKIIDILIIFLWAIFLFYKGQAGIDTYLYQKRFENIQDYTLVNLYEPLFNIIILFFSFFTKDWNYFIALYGTLYLILMKRFISKDILINAIYFMPVIVIDNTFNGLRIGLALLLFIIFKKSKLRFLSFFTHLTSFYWEIRKYSIWVLIGLLIVFTYTYERLINFLTQIILSKLDTYKNVAITTNWYSGLFDVLTLLTLILFSKNHQKFKLKYISLLLLLLPFIFSEVWGIRLIKLELWFMIFFVAKNLYDKKILIIVGSFYTLNFIRQIYMSSNNELNWNFTWLYT